MVPLGLKAGNVNCLIAILLCSCLSQVVAQTCTGVEDAGGLQNAASNLAGDAVVNICKDIVITAPVDVQRPVTFAGQCASPGCRISALQPSNGETVSLFQLGANVGTVTFQNLWLDGGDATSPVTVGTGDNGGAIYANSGTNLIVDTVLFTNNLGSYGGAVYASENATVTDCVFVNNTAQYQGGAFYLDGTAASVSNSNFTENNAEGGGAVYLYTSSLSTSVRGNLFLYNNATSQQGGALYVDSSTVNLTVAGNTFANNTSYQSGGGVYDSSTFYTLISGNSFLQNYAPQGGAIATQQAYTTILSPNVFTGNNADTSQGGSDIYVLQSPTDGSTTFCPKQPVVGVVPGLGGAVNSSCVFANCASNNPCDPAATCNIVGGAPTCTCPSGVSGSGYLCKNTNAGLLAVGASNTFTIPPFVNLAPAQSSGSSTPATKAPSTSTVPPSSTPTSPSTGSNPTPTGTFAKEKGGSSKTGIIAGLAVAGVAAIIIAIAILAFVLYRRKKRSRRQSTLPLVKQDMSGDGYDGSAVSMVSAKEADADGALSTSWRRFSYPELERATNNFAQANLLGEGAFGKVYVATLANGKKVAVKQLKSQSKGVSDRDFLAELGTLGRVRHKNLVSLCGYCVTDDECFLVLDFAANGNLDAALRNDSKPPLDWETRLQIAVGAARGLSYLHNDTEPSILHRDIKSANILLDAKMHAQVADFGLAKLLDEGKTHQSTHVRGTYGYVAPEYALNGQVTKKSDVYSFGVVLLELITGFRALEVTPDGGRKNLVDAVVRTSQSLLGRQQPWMIVDPKLQDQFPHDVATNLIAIATACCAHDESQRPEMAVVLRELESLARGEAITVFKAPVETTGEDSGDWFGPTRSGSVAPGSSSTSYPSQSSWSQPSSGSLNHQLSMNYQMSMLTEGR